MYFLMRAPHQMLVNVLLYETGEESEGIHSLEIAGKTVVLMFESIDDAERYSGLLEAQDFPIPSVEAIDREEIEAFCYEAGYQAQFIEAGFVPSTEEERIYLVPPRSNLDTSNWDEQHITPTDEINKSKELDDIRKRLEGLL